jgi:hypothetical protein
MSVSIAHTEVRRPWKARALGLAALLACATAPALAQEAARTSFLFSADGEYNEIETKYIFGFTDGSDIGLEGEKSIESETNAVWRKRTGRYMALEQEIAFEHTPTQFFSYEVSVRGTGHRIKDDETLGDKSIVRASGLSTKLRYLVLGRGPGSPIGLTISAEPEWSRVDGSTGTATRSLGATFKLVADTELIANRLYAAANLTYAPEVARAVGDAAWGRSSTIGASGAIAWRLTPTITAGAEVEYFHAYDSYGFGAFQGRATYVGPTLHVQITRKLMLAAAYSTQVAGHALADDRHYDLTNFTRHKARLKLEYEF